MITLTHASLHKVFCVTVQYKNYVHKFLFHLPPTLSYLCY